VAVVGCGDSSDRGLKFCVAHDRRLTEEKKVGQSVSVRSSSLSGTGARPIFRCGSLRT